jgi:hypothetical protein
LFFYFDSSFIDLLVIRRARIDKLAQLFDVFNGTMSPVGPRPHAVEYARIIRGYFARHRVKLNGCLIWCGKSATDVGNPAPPAR